MIEQYVYNRINADTTLSNYLADGSGGIHLYPGVIPETKQFESAVAFSLLNSTDNYPNVRSKTVQFNIFSDTHTRCNEISSALADLFNGDTLKTDGGVKVVYSERDSETDLGKDYDTELYQRETSYYFKINESN